MIDIDHIYYIYADIKDTKGSEKIRKLKQVLNNAVGYFYDETINNIQLVRSDQIQEFLQKFSIVFLHRKIVP